MDDRPDRRYLKRSLGLSIGLHLLTLPIAIAIFRNAQFGTDASLGAAFATRETTAIAYLRIEHRSKPHRAPARARERALPPASAPLRVVSFERPVLAHRAVVRTTGPVVHIATAAVPPVRSKQIAVFAVAAPVSERAPAAAVAAPAPIALVSPSPAPVVTPSATPAIVAEEKSEHALDIPPGGWGQSFEHPIVADDAALGDLRSRYHAVSHVSIDVDETGKPVRVTIPAGISDDMRTELERALMELRYVPAECNGLHCPGTLELTL